MTYEKTNPSWNEYQDISNTLTRLLSKGYTKPMIKTVLEQMGTNKDSMEISKIELNFNPMITNFSITDIVDKVNEIVERVNELSSERG